MVFCGRQSPGGHNVIWGLLEALKVHNPKSVLLGFLGEDLNCLPWINDATFIFIIFCLVNLPFTHCIFSYGLCTQFLTAVVPYPDVLLLFG